MSLYGALTTATLGMMSQSYALNTIGVNIANVTTGGYKSTETRFQTVLSRDIFQQQDNGGVRPKDVQNIARQGLLSTTGNDLDVAINGDGFFILSPTLEVGDELFYGRDGTFTVKIENQVTETDTTGQSSAVSSTREGYLVDKNGYYLLGWVPEADGTFSNSGTLQALRVDPDYFADTFEVTTTGQIGLNLPSNNVNINGAQIDTLTIGGTVEAGDTYSVTIDGNTVSYTTLPGDVTIDDVRAGLIAAINSNGATSALVAAQAGETGKINLVSKTPGTGFTATASVTNGGATNDGTSGITTTTANFDHAAAVAAALAGNVPDGYESYSATVVDSNGVRQSIRFNFTKDDTNTWEVSVTTQGDPTAQVDTVTLSGTLQAGDTYSVTVGSTTYSHTTTGAEADYNAVAQELINDINADTNATVTASLGGTGQIVLTADTAGTSFTSSVSKTEGASVAQVDTITLGGSRDAGDVYSATINGTTVTYTVIGGDTLADVRNGLLAAINANGVLAPLVTATAGGAGQIVVTSDTAGTPFTLATALQTDIGTVDGTATSANTTANRTAINDASATKVTTTANDIGLVTTAAQTLSFDGNGQLTPQPPADLTFAMTFKDGGTATVAFDIERITQFGGSFLPTFYDSNGFEASNLSRLQFDNAGHVVGSFGGLNNRNLYKIPVAIFINPNGLEMKTGNVFAETIYSGTSSIHAVDQTGQADFVPAARELSNVDIADEFSRMIQTQAAYNANATAFRTADEMTAVARDLKA